ncbi:helix-turn-helix transcriptional regulator [Streptomyces sp. NPDC049954]|uniref:helix-turn-helix domain-containing protein n=1 Tax=Streptomyces sp. NPDC049954 TaxID=3155779 RepID=UPI003444319F
MLKHYREKAGKTQVETAKAMHCDRSHLARFEAGTRVPDREHAQAADDFLGAGGALIVLWDETDWYPIVEHPDWFKQRARMDDEAISIRIYQSMVIPGLLQVREYAAAIFAQVVEDVPVEERVRARLSRQTRYLERDGPFLMAVLDESCLRNSVESYEIMRLQCAHLLKVGSQPNVCIQVVPSDSPKAVRPNTPLMLINLPTGVTWAYSESIDWGHFSEDPSVIDNHARTYDVLRADALSASESAVLIRDAMERYGQNEPPRPQRRELGQEQLQRKQRRRVRGDRVRFPRRRPRP